MRPARGTTELPTGTITFLLTDIEGSTRLWDAEPEAMEVALLRHNELIADAVETHGGRLVRERGEGDSTFSVFTDASAALAAAVAMQRGLHRERWPSGIELRVRAALHAGDARLLGPGDYSAPVVNRAARLRGLAHGGQTLVSGVTAALASGDLPSGTTLKDLGTHRLRGLSRPEPVAQLCHVDLPDEFPPLASPDVRPTNLPEELTSFVGRADDLVLIPKLLAEHRLVTLAGPGGVGKTRLARRVASELLDAYPDGVWFVDLAPLDADDLVLNAVASAVGAREEAGRDLGEIVTEKLDSTRTLLVLDNCEHLVDACTEIVGRLLRSTTQLRILATSREPLTVLGGATHRLSPLEVPTDAEAAQLAANDAARLFSDRAALVRPDFSVTAANAAAVARICSTLDGLPLAIELAAGWTHVLTPADISQRLEEHQGFLRHEGPDVPERHRTLEAAIDWSYQLLSDDERTLLRRAAVFAGSFSLEALQGICADDRLPADRILPTLGGLVDKSLVAPLDHETGSRFTLLEMVRRYAASRADEVEWTNVTDRHGAHFLRLAEDASRLLEGPDQATWLQVLETEHGNLLSALRALTERGSDQALRMASAMSRFWVVRGYWSEGRRWLEHALASANGGLQERGQALHSTGAIMELQGDLDDALETYREALRLRESLGSEHEVAVTLRCIGNVNHRRGAIDDARVCYERSLDLATRGHHDRERAAALNSLAILAMGGGDYEKAVALADECVTVADDLADHAVLARARLNLAVCQMNLGRLEAAATSFEGALEIGRLLGDRHSIAAALSGLGDLAEERDDLEQAKALHEESLRLRRDLGDRPGTARALYALGEVARREGRFDTAERLLSESLGIYRQLGAPQGIAAQLMALANVQRHAGDLGTAESLAREALGLVLDLNQRRGIVECLEIIAGVLCENDLHDRAAQLLGAIEAARDRWGLRRPDALAADHLRDQERIRSALGVKRFDALYAEGRTHSVDEAISTLA